EGRWVGYDMASKGHRIYYPTKRHISVERNVIFSKLPEVFDLIEPDVRGSEEQSSDVDVDQETRVEEAVDDTQSVNAEMTNVKVNPPVNLTLPELRCSMRNKKPSQYIQDLKSGEFTTGLRGQTVPTGIRVPDDLLENPESLKPELHEPI
ncbi:hypothetical protein APHAL10511_000241, partial [Amanita phalloides]